MRQALGRLRGSSSPDRDASSRTCGYLGGAASATQGRAAREEVVAKMASHAIFQYNVLAIDDTHNTWTNMIVKMTILRLLGSSDDKEKIGVARPEGQRIEETVKKSSQNKQDRDILLSPVKPMMSKLYSPVQ